MRLQMEAIFKLHNIPSITYCCTHTQIKDFMCMSRYWLDHVEGGLFLGYSKTILAQWLLTVQSVIDRDITVRTQNKM